MTREQQRIGDLEGVVTLLIERIKILEEKLYANSIIELNKRKFEDKYYEYDLDKNTIKFNRG